MALRDWLEKAGPSATHATHATHEAESGGSVATVATVAPPSEVLAVGKAEPSPEDRDFFRAILPGATLAKYAGADAEDRRAKVLAQLNGSAIKRAMALSPDGMVTVGVKVDGKVWTQDLKIPAEKFDPWLILERLEAVTLQ